MKNITLTQNQKGILFFIIVTIAVVTIHLLTDKIHR